MQNLKDIHYFISVVEQGSFTAASKMLGVAKSQLSFRVSRLEDRLGIRLIQRTTRRSFVTEVGRRYYEQCRLMLAAAEQAQQVINDAKETSHGRLRIACPVLFAQLLLAPVLVGYMREHPEVHVDLDMVHHQTDLLAGGYDMAFRVRASIPDSSFIIRSFGVDPQVLVASPGMLGRRKVLREPTALSTLPSVDMFSAEGRHFWTLLDTDKHAQRIEHFPNLVTDDLQVLYQAVIGGLGVAQLPEFICHTALSDGRLVRLLPAWSLPLGNVHAIYPSRKGHTSAMRSFIDYTSHHLPLVLKGVQQGRGFPSALANP